MTDLIFRHDALCALAETNPMNRDMISRFDASQKIKNLPSLESIEGFSLDWLVYVATISKEKGVTPQDAVDLMRNAERIFELIQEEQQNIFRKILQGEL